MRRYSFKDELVTCLVCPMFHCDPGLHRKLWSGFLQVKRRSLSLPGLPGIIIVVVCSILDSGSLSYPLSFLSHYLERLVRSLVYLPLIKIINRFR